MPVSMNPILENYEPNYWLSCILIDKDAMCKQMHMQLILELFCRNSVHFLVCF